jgi:hypothetical protein
VASRNGRQRPARPRIELAATANATSEEAAAIAAAVEGFLRDTASAPAARGPSVSPWARAALFGSAGLDAAGATPWGDPVPWGRGS